MESNKIWKRWSLPERLVILGLIIALVFTLTGFEVASASIPDSNGEIHGCMKGKHNQLSAIDAAVTPTCPGGETALNWNQGNAVEGYHAGLVNFTSSGTNVAILSVGAGNYVINAKLIVSNFGGALDDDSCVLALPNSDESDVVLAAGSSATLSMQGVYSGGAGTIPVKCTDGLSVGSQTAENIAITAIAATNVSYSNI
jgi:hypothetical protein